jgi:hypothetical protein
MNILTTIGSYLFLILFYIVPRWITEEVAVVYDDLGVMSAVCLAKRIPPEKKYDEIVVVRWFNIFGLALFSKVYKYVEET